MDRSTLDLFPHGRCTVRTKLTWPLSEATESSGLAGKERNGAARRGRYLLCLLYFFYFINLLYLIRPRRPPRSPPAFPAQSVCSLPPCSWRAESPQRILRGLVPLSPIPRCWSRRYASARRLSASRRLWRAPPRCS